MPAKRILIIDNDVLIQEATKVCLGMTANWEVITASSGSEGLIEAKKKQPDAILLDLVMPDVDGMSTFQKLQASPATQQIPVVLLTGKVEANELASYQALGLRGAIAKPFSPLNLASEIAQILGWEIDQ